MFYKGHDNWITLPVLLSCIVLSLLLLQACGGSAGVVDRLDVQAGSPTGGELPVADPEPMKDTSLEDVLAEVDALDKPASVDATLFDQLKAELARVLSENAPGRITSAAPLSIRNKVLHIAPVTSSRDGVSFVWLERNAGDYNMDGEVNASDLTPLGQRFNQALDDGESDAWDRRIDGDEDGKIGLGDITPIGQNYLSRVSGYNVYRRRAGADTQLELIGSVARGEATPVPKAGLIYRFTDGHIPSKTPWVYEIRPIAGTTEGQPSAQLTVFPGDSHGIADGLFPILEITEGEKTHRVCGDELILEVGADWSMERVIGLVYGKLGGKLLGKINRQDAYRVLIPSRGPKLQRVMEFHALEQNPAYALHYNYLYYPDEVISSGKDTSTTYTDPGYSDQWALDTIGAETAWDYSEGNGILIGVVDSGFTMDHEDLSGQLHSYWRVNATELEESVGNIGTDVEGHGTLVSGVMVMKEGNSLGGVGLACDAQIVMVKAGCYESGAGSDWVFTSSEIATSIGVLIDEGVDVINLSLGGGSSSNSLRNAIEDAHDNDIVVVASAGNNNEDDVSYPAGYDGVVCVGAIEENGDRWEWDATSGSNYGSWVNICAPGDDVYSTDNDGTYDEYSGTSLATPYVSAAVALIREENPSYSRASVITLLYNSASVIVYDEPIGPLLNCRGAMEYGMEEQNIVVDPLSFFEIVEMGETEMTTITISNTGELELMWIAVFNNTDTGLSVTLEEYYGYIAGGEERELEFTYTAPPYGGAFETEIRITSNDFDEPAITLDFLLAVTEPEIDVSPLTLDFELDRGDSETQYVTVDNTGSGTLGFTVSDNGSYLSASSGFFNPLDPETEVSAGHSEQVAVTIETGAMIGGNIDGDYVGTVYIDSNDIDEPVVEVTVNYTIHDTTSDAHMVVDPSPRYYMTNPSQVSSEYIQLTNSGSVGNLDWTAIATSGDFTVHAIPGSPIAPGDDYGMELIITAPATPGSYSGMVEVMSMELPPVNHNIPIFLTVLNNED